MSVYSEFIRLRTYSRWLPEQRRRETWEETVDRYCDFIFNETKNCSLIPDKTKYKIKKYILNKEVMPSMRLLWSAGENCRRDNISAYNCTAMAVHSLVCFGETMYILLAGAGVGYSVESKYTSQLPEIKKQKNLPVLRYIVEDTRLGWKESIDYGINEWFTGRDVIFDYSKIRPAGAPLVTSGGYASGPDPLRRCHEFLRETILCAQERKLRPIEVSDMMCEIGSAVVCGGVRRTAMICLCDVDDEEMRNYKQGSFHPRRFMANISAVYNTKPNVLDFTQEFVDMARSGSGERGIFNLFAAKKRSPKRRDRKKLVLSNPCFRGDMRLLTVDGYHKLEDLEGMDVEIINKDGGVSTGSVWCSGEKDIVEVKFRGVHNKSIFCTTDHKFMLSDGSECTAGDLSGNRLKAYVNIKTEFDTRAFLAGFIQGDGCTNRLNSPIHRGMEVRFGAKDLDVASMFGQGEGSWYSREAYEVAREYHLEGAHLPHRKLPPREYISPDFLSGLFSANGCVIKKYRVAIKSTCYDMLVELGSLLEDWFGIDSYITTNKPTRVKFSNGEYLCRESYDLNITRFESVVKFAENISFAQEYKRNDLLELISVKSPLVSSVSLTGRDFVYDFSEPITNWGVVDGFVVHNCGETILRDMGCCNLTSVVMRATDDFDSVLDKIKTATWLGCIQATLTHFPAIRKEWTENAEEERLLGVSLSGLCDNMELITPETLRHWKNKAVKTAKLAAGILDINMPSAISLVKPEGTCSQLTNSASGMHSRWSPFYIRRVRISSHDALFRCMVDQGMPYEMDKGNHDTAVFSFPVAAPVGAKTREDDTALGQLDWYRTLVENWTEQNASATIFVKEEEWLDVTAYVYNNFDAINGVTFFPYDNKKYEQAPYQSISEIEYHRMVKEMPEIDFSLLSKYETRDETEGAQTYACSSATGCEI